VKGDHIFHCLDGRRAAQVAGQGTLTRQAVQQRNEAPPGHTRQRFDQVDLVFGLERGFDGGPAASDDEVLSEDDPFFSSSTGSERLNMIRSGVSP
jgi:hypothetical protein